jgi:transcriptional regulator with XRE-family HTH domain
MEKNEGIERILQIMKHYNLSQRQFAMKIDMNPQTLNSMIIRNYEIRITIIADILRAFPEVSIEWLVLGDGDMIKQPKEDENWKVTQFIPVPNNELVDALKDHIATLKADNERMRKEIDEYRREKSGAAAGYGYMAAEGTPLTKTE